MASEGKRSRRHGYVTFWTDVATAAIGLGAGALAGGWVAARMAAKQTDRSIAATREVEEQRWEREQIEARRRRTQDAAATLLEPLAVVHDALPAMALKNMTPRDRPSTVGLDAQAEQAMDTLTYANRVVVPLIDDVTFQKRFKYLINLAVQLKEAKHDRTRKSRDQVDMVLYLKYIRLYTEALIRGGPIPADVEPPDFARATLDRWEPEPKPEGWE
jgi:hypothetical protein